MARRNGASARAEPLPTRLHPGSAAPEAPDALWARLRAALPPPPQRWQRDRLDADALLRALLDASPPRAKDPAAAARTHALMIEAEYGGRTDSWAWRGASDAAFAARVALFARWLVASQGGVAAVCTADLVRHARAEGRSPTPPTAWHDPLALGLRAALAGAPQPAFAAARDAALALAGEEGWAAAAFFAFPLADDGPETHALQPGAVLPGAVRAGVDPAREPALVPLLAEVRPSAAAAWRGQRRGLVQLGSVQVEPARIAATVAAVAARSGEPVVPSLFWLYRQAKGDDAEVFARAILDTREDDALAHLAPDLDRRAVRAALNRAAKADPAWTLRRCVALLAAGRGGPAMDYRVREMVDSHGAAAARKWCADLDARARSRLDALAEPPAAEAFAPRADWPAVLRDPPWRAAVPPMPDGPAADPVPLPAPFAHRPAERLESSERRRGRAIVVSSTDHLSRLLAEAAAGPHRDALLGPLPFSAPLPNPGAPEAEVLSWLERRLAEVEAGDHSASLYAGLHDGLERQPEALALMLWNRGGPRLRSLFHDADGQTSDPAPFVLDRFGAAAVPGVVRLIEADPARELERFAFVDAAEIAPAAARALRGGPDLRRPALAWLLRHPEASAAGLLPPALGAPGADRTLAARALRRIRAGSPARAAALDAAVARFAGVDAATAAAAEALWRDGLLDVPDAVPVLPGWFVPADLRRPALIVGGALPDDAVRLVAEMLAFSTREDVYAGLDAVKRCCTADSLAAFASHLFEAWLARGGPGQAFWALRAMGWLGDDSCVPRLAAQIRRWLDLKARPQAAIGIEALADLGSDAALNGLANLADRLGSKSLRAKAARHLAEAAAARGLSADALADRIAPDLGLDARGGIDLDTGARHFRAELDASLKPVLRDGAGRILKDLPKPAKADGSGRAAAAAAAWAALKRDVRAAAGPQIARIEAMLASGRRVPPDDFCRLFAAHPLVGPLARRLVWTLDARDDGVAPLAFSIDEDGAPIAADGAAVALDGAVGLTHPVDLEPDARAAWRRHFERRGLEQPFPQLDRDVYRLSAAERPSSAVHRVSGISVESGWLRGMGHRGWAFTRPVEDALMWEIERPVTLADGVPARARLGFSPGLRVGAPETDEGPCILATVDLIGVVPRGREAPVAWGRLSPAAASELIREVLILAGRGAHPTAAEAASDGAPRAILQ